MKNLKELFLGRAAIDALNLVEKVETIHSDDSERIKQAFKKQIPKFVKGLGELKGELSIKLKPGSEP